MAYQNAVREAELTQIKMKPYLSGTKKTPTNTSEQLTTQELRREQTEQKNAAARMRAQGNLGTQALRQQSALLAGRFAPATKQVREDVDAQDRRAKAAQTAQRDQVRGMRRTSQELDKQIEALEIEQADTHFSGTGLSENGKSVTQL